jgi:hypothetical protein
MPSCNDATTSEAEAQTALVHEDETGKIIIRMLPTKSKKPKFYIQL